MIVAYADVEVLVQQWLLTTPVAALVTRSGGGVNIFRAMPIAWPKPSIILNLVGGGPDRRSAMGQETARITFDCWAVDRTTASAVSRALVAACENLSETGGYTDGAHTLAVAEAVNMVWLPDPESDIPRYVVDAMFTVIPG